LGTHGEGGGRRSDAAFRRHWSTVGTWEAMERARGPICGALPQRSYEFHAASADQAVDALRDVAFPVRLIAGDMSRCQSTHRALIAERLCAVRRCLLANRLLLLDASSHAERTATKSQALTPHFRDLPIAMSSMFDLSCPRLSRATTSYLVQPDGRRARP
jgi:hypothetical protein